MLTGLTLSISIAAAAPPVKPVTVPAPQTPPVSVPLPQEKDKCPVCGMFVSKYPDWIVSVSFKDSPALYFDGAKDFFIWYHNTQKYTPSKNRVAITAITVSDYYSLKQIDARQAHFVIGSDVYGPMGKELVPFGKLADAHAFLKDHKGKLVLRFSDVTPAALKSLE
jgi:nitrous oxide reductase accessory protein NosL